MDIHRYSICTNWHSNLWVNQSSIRVYNRSL